MSGRSKDQDLIDDLVAWMQAPDTQTVQTNGHATPKSTSGSSDVPDEIIIEKCRGASNAAKFSDLFDYGDTSGHGADDSLLGILKFYTQDPDQLERLMRRSKLARPKWDEGRAGRSWLRYSIDNALKDVGETYDWGRRGSRPLASSSSLPLGCGGDDDTSAGDAAARIVWFAELGEPG